MANIRIDTDGLQNNISSMRILYIMPAIAILCIRFNQKSNRKL